MAEKNYIEKVAIVGAGGNVGKYMVESLLKTGKHTVTAVTRTDGKTKLPEGVQVKYIDYDDQSSIVEALRGQDALVFTMGVTAPKDQTSKLIRAAAEANVPWVLPSEWGQDSANEPLGVDVMIGPPKKADRDLIVRLGKSSFIGVITGFWYEWSIAFPHGFGFNIAERAVTFYDDGETPINVSTWFQVGRAVAALLSLKIHPDGENDKSPCLEQFKNGFIYTSSFTVSQKDMLESLMRVTSTSLEDWKVTKEPSHVRYAGGIKDMKGGDMSGYVRALYARVFYPDGSGNPEKTKGSQNDVLGLPKEDIDEATKRGIERIEETAKILERNRSQQVSIVA